MFRGREMAHRDLGFKMMERLAEEVGEVGMVETRPKIEGPNLSTIIAAKKAAGKGASRPGFTPGSGGLPPAPPRTAANRLRRPLQLPPPRARRPRIVTGESGG